MPDVKLIGVILTWGTVTNFQLIVDLLEHSVWRNIGYFDGTVALFLTDSLKVI